MGGNRLDDASGGLPDDIIYSIMLKLPFKSLLRFQTLSKQWRDAITRRKFFEEHGKMTTMSVTYILCLKNFRLQLHVYPTSQGRQPQRAIQLLPPNTHGMTYKSLYLKPSSDGLIGFVIVDKATFDSAFLIWNPFTGQQKEISIPLMELRRTIGFGYDATIDDYKVVVIFSDDCADKIMVRAMNKCDDEWRTIYFAPSDRVVASQKGVDLDGTIWWTALRASDKSSVLMKFSLADEKLSTMAWPPDANPNPLSKLLYRLERYDGSLYMIDCHDDRHDEFYIWRIIKQGNETVWELPARRVPRSGCIYPMGFMRDGALLARGCGYNPSYACISSNKKELDIFELEEKGITWYSDYIVLDTETLISP